VCGFRSVGQFDALLVFVQDRNRLRNVLAQVVGYSRIQGVWDGEGVEHFVPFEGQYAIVVLPHRTQGHFDLRVKLMGQPWKMDFAWDATTQAYRPLIRKHAAKQKLACRYAENRVRKHDGFKRTYCLTLP